MGLDGEEKFCVCLRMSLVETIGVLRMEQVLLSRSGGAKSITS